MAPLNINYLLIIKVKLHTLRKNIGLSRNSNQTRGANQSRRKQPSLKTQTSTWGPSLSDFQFLTINEKNLQKNTLSLSLKRKKEKWYQTQSLQRD